MKHEAENRKNTEKSRKRKKAGDNEAKAATKVRRASKNGIKSREQNRRKAQREEERG